MSQQTTPYSYHTFFFPFLWNDGRNVTREQFVNCLSDRWHFTSTAATELSDAELSERYNQYHYFNAAARNAIYAEKTANAVVWEYRCDLSPNGGWCGCEDGATARYVIEKGDRCVALTVNAIRLKLYNTGIGILMFELENDSCGKLEDVLWINDFGRRIYMPFSDNSACSGCADAISLTYGDSVVCDGRFTGKPTEFCSTCLAEPILFLLQNGRYAVTADESRKNESTFFIEPIIDDRMFAACYYINAELVSRVTAWENGEYRYLRDAAEKAPDAKDNCANALYRLMFVDGGGMTCQSRPMAHRLLEKHLYDRWIEYGTLIGITDYSMTTLTSSDADYLVRNFRTEYVEMMALTLAQRASLLGFERMISDSALGKRDIQRLQRRYLMFQSQLLLKEVTPQQQGIELYHRLLNAMFIPEQTGEIENQIRALFEQKTARNEARENLILFILAILGVFEAVDLLVGWISTDISPWLKLAVSAVACVAAVCWYRPRRKR